MIGTMLRISIALACFRMVTNQLSVSFISCDVLAKVLDKCSDSNDDDTSGFVLLEGLK